MHVVHIFGSLSYLLSLAAFPAFFELVFGYLAFACLTSSIFVFHVWSIFDLVSVLFSDLQFA